ncbi:MAG: alpha/beta hydrolase [Magnetococcales bacterium]|nr:alpha/beta hydrolase [Magnetococcales bacterium]
MSEVPWPVVMVFGAIGLYALACLHLFLTQYHKVYRVQRGGEGTPHDWGIDYESVTIDNQGKHLCAWWIPGSLERPVLLFCHGNGLTIHRLSKQVLFLRPLGLSILVFDYQGYGYSAGKVSEAGILSDTAAVWHYLVEQRGIKGEDILVYGHSLGGGAATWLAARYPCAGIILEGTFTSIPEVASDHYPWLPTHTLARIEFNNMANITRIRVPVFITHSTEDSIVPFYHAQRLYTSAQAPKHLLPIPGRHYDAFVQFGSAGLNVLKEFFKIPDTPPNR